LTGFNARVFQQRILACAGRASTRPTPHRSGELDIFSLGLTWWLSPVFIIHANDRYIESEHGGFSVNSSAVTTRFPLLLE